MNFKSAGSQRCWREALSQNLTELISIRVVITLSFNPSKVLIAPYFTGVSINTSTYTYNYSDIFHFSAVGTFVKSLWRSTVFPLLKL